jgi:hypothetical protein
MQRTLLYALTGVLLHVMLGAQHRPVDVFSVSPDLPVLERPLPAEAPVLRVSDRQFEELHRLPIGSRTRITLPIKGSMSVIADVQRYAVIDEQSVLRAMTSSGPVTIPAPRSVLLKGIVEGKPGSFVTLALYPGLALGRIALGDEVHEEYIITPLTSTMPAPLAVVPSTSLLRSDYGLCAVTDDDVVHDRPSVKGAEQTQAGTLRRVTLALEGDTPYYLDHGSDLTVATAYAEAVIAASSAIYERDVSASLYIGQLVIWTTTDPYPGTNSTNLLTQFRDYWRANNAGVGRSVAMLLSGQNGIGGVAYLNTLCDKQWGYAVSGLNNNVVYPRTTYAWDTDVTSHELGHNIGSPHTHSCTWNPPIDSCYQAEGNCYTGTKAVRGTIMSYCHLTSMGTALQFHPLVSQLMQNRLAQASCVSIISDLTVSAGTDTAICSGSSVTLRGTVSGGTAPFTITWTPNAGMANSNGLTPTIQPAATTTYIIEVRDIYNATDRDTVVVTVNPRVTVNVATEYQRCAGSPLSIALSSVGGTGPYTIRWRSSEIDTTTTTASLTYVPAVTGPLTVTVTDSKGCRDEKTTSVVVSPMVRVNIDPIADVACPGTSITLNAQVAGGTAPFTFDWFSDERGIPGMDNEVRIAPDATQTIMVVVSDARGCSDTATTTVRVHDVRAHLEGSKIVVPNISRCDREFDAWVTIVNDGVDTLVFTEIRNDVVLASSRDLPVRLLPKATHVLPIRVLLPMDQLIADTVYLVASTCDTRLPITITGDRGVIMAAGDDRTHAWSKVPECRVVYDRTLSLSVDNRTPAGVTITGARSRVFGTKLDVTSSNDLVSAHSIKTITFKGRFAALPSQVMDTIDVDYSAQGCSGTFVARAHVPTTEIAIQQPTVVIFDTTISPALEDVDRRVVLRISGSDVERLSITSVTITGPFRTSLRVGDVIPANVDHPVTIAFQPSLLAQDGVAGGELFYSIDSCLSSDTIHLEAVRTVVSIDGDDGEHVGDIVLRSFPDHLVINATSALVTVSDLQGRLVMSSTIVNSGTIDLSTLHHGLYFVAVVGLDGSALRKTICW